MICDQFVRRLSMLTGKKIVLGITGGIAAYKSAELTRRLIKSGAEVKVIMTRNSTIYYPSHITDIDRSSRFHQYVFSH